MLVKILQKQNLYFLFCIFVSSVLGCASNYRVLGRTLVGFSQTGFKPEEEFRQITEKSP